MDKMENGKVIKSIELYLHKHDELNGWEMHKNPLVISAMSEGNEANRLMRVKEFGA